MKETRINLNEFIKVKLTDLGRDIYYHRFDDVNKICRRTVCKPSYPKVDDEGYTEFQLWDFMHIYGNYLYLGALNVISPLEIIYEEKEN